jgi:hypothetical protein
LLQSCDLQFFHLERPRGTESLTQSNTAELHPCLRRQNLKALALNIPRCGPPLGSVGGQGTPWPKLKALYLREGNQHWLEQLPKFEELQILSLQNLTSEIPTINQSAIEKIAKYRHLQVIDLVFELDDVEALLNIAHGCPLLRKFSARHIRFRGEADLAEEMLLDLLHSLPRLEFLALGLKFQMDGSMLQDIARHCPRLTVLDLPDTQLYLSLSLMTKVHPLGQLEAMHFARIYFEDPRWLMQRDKIQSIATKWRIPEASRDSVSRGRLLSVYARR